MNWTYGTIHQLGKPKISVQVVSFLDDILGVRIYDDTVPVGEYGHILMDITPSQYIKGRNIEVNRYTFNKDGSRRIECTQDKRWAGEIFKEGGKYLEMYDYVNSVLSPEAFRGILFEGHNDIVKIARILNEKFR